MEIDPTLKNADQTVNEASPFKVGQLLDGKYEIISLLGRGGMGAVYRVRHTLLNVELALKTLDTQRLGDASSSRRFQTEAKAAFSLKHPNLVKVHDFGVFEDGHPFLVMDLVQGKTLQTLIKERGQLSFSEIESIFVQLCFGLAHAHQQQVVHRDIKPANIMIVDGLDLKDEGSVKILDFGIAKIVNEDRGEMQTLTQTGEIFGSPYYMSPEQCSGEAVDQRSDVYSLGCVLFEAITGTPPLVGSNALRTMMLHVNDQAPSLKEAALGSQFPQVFEQIVAKMLAKSPRDRYSDLGIVAHEIYKACTGNSYAITSQAEEAQKAKEVAARQKNTVSFTPLKLASLLTAVAAVSVVATLCAIHLRHAKLDANQKPTLESNSAPKPVEHFFPDPNELPSELAKSAAESKKVEFRNSFEKVSKIAATDVVVVDNKKFRRIVFPDISCGVIRFGRFAVQTARANEKISAIGPRLVPATGRLVYNINEVNDRNVLFNPFIFDKFAPDLFSGLEYESASEDLDMAKAPTSQIEKETHDGVMHLFSTASKWSNLDYVNLRRVKNLNDVFESMNEFSHLDYLAIVDAEIDPAFLARQPFVSKLGRIHLVFSGDGSEVIKTFGDSKKIREIAIGKDVKVSPESLKSLSKCPKLVKLSCCQRKFSDEAITAIAGIRQLVRVYFIRGVLTPSQKAGFEKYWTRVSAQEDIFAEEVEVYKPKRRRERKLQ